MNISVNITLDPNCDLESIIKTGRGWQVRVRKKKPISMYPHYEHSTLYGRGSTIEDAVKNLQPEFSKNRIREKCST